MPSQIYLVRHGETAWSKSGQHTGKADIPLTPTGEQEALNLAERLHGQRFSRVLTSPRSRAQRTCELAGLAAAAEVEPDLAEWDYGDYESRRSIDILVERPDWNLYLDGCPHGETPAEVSDRADRLIARLQGMEGIVAAFSHGHFGRVLAVRWIGLPLPAAQHLVLGTASLSILGHERHDAGKHAIVLWNARDSDRSSAAS